MSPQLTKHPDWSADHWYNFSCLYSLASTKRAENEKAYADRAMELLQKAVEAGWDEAAHTANDADLAPLRDRDDFKKLLAELEKKDCGPTRQKAVNKGIRFNGHKTGRLHRLRRLDRGRHVIDNGIAPLVPNALLR